MKIKISPSLLSADFGCLKKEIERAEDAGADLIHFDVMDGVFVNNISFGIPVLESVRKCTSLPLDIHLMISEPERYIKRFAECGADIITVHAEACRDTGNAIRLIKECGKSAGLALKPGTPLNHAEKYLPDIDMLLIMTVEPGFGGQGFMDDMLSKIADAREFFDSHGLETDIEVDGGINEKTSHLVREAGANVLVAGSYLYHASDFAKALDSLKAQ